MNFPIFHMFLYFAIFQALSRAFLLFSSFGGNIRVAACFVILFVTQPDPDMDQASRLLGLSCHFLSN